MMSRIKKRDIDPAILAEIKDEAAWEKAKMRFTDEAKAEGEKNKAIAIAKRLLDVLAPETIALKQN